MLRKVWYIRQSQHVGWIKQILFTQAYVHQLQNKEDWSSFQPRNMYAY